MYVLPKTVVCMQRAVGMHHGMPIPVQLSDILCTRGQLEQRDRNVHGVFGLHVQVCDVGFPQQKGLWGKEASGLDLLLECSNWIGFHDTVQSAALYESSPFFFCL